MELIIISILLSLMVVGILAFILGGGNSPKKGKPAPPFICPPGFSPALIYKEKYGETGIAYDEKQKAICLVKTDTQQRLVVSYQDVLAVAIFEDDALIAKSSRTDEEGKESLTQILTEEIKLLFQDNSEQSENLPSPTSSGTSSNITLKILVNNATQPVHQIQFLNMEAKKGGVIHTEALGHGKNWQDLLTHLVRLAGRPAPTQNQPQQTPSSSQTTQAEPEPAGASQT